MGAFRDPMTINNIGEVGSVTNPTTGTGLALERENQRAIMELPGALLPEKLSILDGSISPTRAAVIVDTEGGAPADDLTVIATTLSDGSSLHEGMELRLQAADQTRVVTVRHSAAVNGILTTDGVDLVLNTAWWLILRLENGTWRQVSVSEPVNIASKTTAGVVQVGDGIDVEQGVLSVPSVPLATASTPGLMRPDGATCTVDSAGVLSVLREELALAGYLTEFRNFFEQSPPLGWAVRNGALLENAESAYPALWAALHAEKNAWKCKTLEEWNALSNAAGGCGGAPFFVLDEDAKSIKLPDTRGDYERGAGSSFLETVGAWHGDAIRNITAQIYQNHVKVDGFVGAFYGVLQLAVQTAGAPNTYNTPRHWGLDASRVVPTASENRPRSYGLLGCVYVGRPM